MPLQDALKPFRVDRRGLNELEQTGKVLDPVGFHLMDDADDLGNAHGGILFRQHLRILEEIVGANSSKDVDIPIDLKGETVRFGEAPFPYLSGILHLFDL